MEFPVKLNVDDLEQAVDLYQAVFTGRDEHAT